MVWGQTKKGVEGLVVEDRIAIEIRQLTEPVWWLVIMSQCNDTNRYSNIILFVVVVVLMPRPYEGC